MPDLSGVTAVVVTHNSEADIGPCLDAVLAQGLEVIVVDNGSADRTREEVARRPGVRLIANPWNRGFAAAANQGITAAAGPLVLLLNPDAVLLHGVEALAEACTKGGAAAAGGKLLDEQGRPQMGFMIRRFPTPVSLIFEVLGLNRLWRRNPVNRRYRCLDLDPDIAAEVEQPAGAFLMLRRDRWQELGGFDENFRPVWFEDVDFLRRARDAGYRAFYTPAAAARHRGAHSVGRLPWESRQLYWYDSLLCYTAKHFRPGWVRAVRAAVIVGCILRSVAAIFSGGARPLWVYGRIIRLAGCKKSGETPFSENLRTREGF